MCVHVCICACYIITLFSINLAYSSTSLRLWLNLNEFIYPHVRHMSIFQSHGLWMQSFYHLIYTGSTGLLKFTRSISANSHSIDQSIRQWICRFWPFWIFRQKCLTSNTGTFSNKQCDNESSIKSVSTFINCIFPHFKPELFSISFHYD